MRPLIFVESQIRRTRTRIEYVLKARTNFKRRSTASNVEIFVPTPSDVDSPQFKATLGKAVYQPDRDGFVWTLKQLEGQREVLMRAEFGLPSLSAESGTAKQQPPMTVQFEIPYFTVSGIQVRYLKIMEKSGYPALPWVRYITVAGNYQIRMQ